MKIFELKLTDEEGGVEAISFVEDPAIGVDFMYFGNVDAMPWILKELELRGEAIPMDSIYLQADTQFSTVGDLLKGLTALDILGKNGVKKDEEGVEVFRYAGTSAERPFCKAMLQMNRVYSRTELKLLDSQNPGFGSNGANLYDVFKYKGGPNCQHYWERLTMFKSGGKSLFISHGPALNDAGKTNNIKDKSSAGSVTNNGYLTFSADDKRIVTGPAMIPDLKILRLDEDNNPYFVFFSRETIAQISQRVFQQSKHNQTNINHNIETKGSSNTLIESWLISDEKFDKSKGMGFNLPIGTWMTSYYIGNEDTWNSIKSGQIKGFSVEGSFVHNFVELPHNLN